MGVPELSWDVPCGNKSHQYWGISQDCPGMFLVDPPDTKSHQYPGMSPDTKSCMTHNICQCIDPWSCTPNKNLGVFVGFMYGLNVLLVLVRTTSGSLLDAWVTRIQMKKTWEKVVTVCWGLVSWLLMCLEGVPLHFTWPRRGCVCCMVGEWGGGRGGGDQGYLITHLLTIHPYRILVGSCLRIMCDIAKEREVTVECEQCVGERQYQLWVMWFSYSADIEIFPFLTWMRNS